MGLLETLILYCIAGAAVAGAVYLSGDNDRGWRSSFQLATAIAFWPLYLPILLSRPEKSMSSSATRAAEPDQMAQAIAQVERELDAAFSSLDGWAENVLSREKDRLVELRTALALQAARIREMDALITETNSESTVDDPSPDALVVDRRAISEQARRKNLQRLHEVRRRSYDDLMGTLAWIRELVSMIHLAKFTGAPASRAEELVAQIASAVEGVSAVTWQNDLPEQPDDRRAGAGNSAA